MSDTRNEDPDDFFSCVLSGRLMPDDHELRRRRKAIMAIVREARRDERKRMLAIVRDRAQELAYDVTDAQIHAPRMVASCRARRDEARHILRAVRNLKP